jgi:hypothetical protein
MVYSDVNENRQPNSILFIGETNYRQERLPMGPGDVQVT